MSEIRLVNGKPLLRAGKLAEAGACCDQCNCDMAELVASSKTVSVTATFNLPQGQPCPPPPFPQPVCQCPQGVYTLTANLVNGALGGPWLGTWQNVTVAGVTASILVELFCENCEYVLRVSFYTFPAFSPSSLYNCLLYFDLQAPVGNQGNESLVGITPDFFKLESKRIDGVCVPKDFEADFEFPDVTVTGSVSLSVA